jgi:hypothetical protein
MTSVKKVRRPRLVTFLSLVVLYVAADGWVRFVQALRNWEFLRGFIEYLPAYLAVSGLMWGIAGLPLAWGLWRGSAWAPRYTELAAILFSVYYWSDRLFLSGSPDRNLNWPFALGMNLVILVLFTWILARRNSSAYFRRDV